MNKVDERVIASIKKRESLCEPFIKLSLLLKTGGIEADGYLGMCGDRIADSLLIDGEDVRIDFINFPDIELTAAGVQMCREVLECYVSVNIIADAFEALMEEKEARMHINVISWTLRKMNLYELLRVFVKSDARIRRFVIEEAFQRSIFIRCCRKMRRAYYSAFVRMKYRNLISFSRKVAAVDNEQ